ncbi:uncharacterized protein LOC134451041 [Engraulis encrasicolus]|uniref:uncharacterized protein LOC134451041 n=1 Tax=Engraulis encrasicolus TaxID=184585 RepID=UPI002FD02EE2
MNPLVFTLLLVSTCSADVQDLTGKVMFFSGDVAHVEIPVSRDIDNTVTVCLRYRRTEHNNDTKQVLFTLQTRSVPLGLQVRRSDDDFTVKNRHDLIRYRNMFRQRKGAGEWNSVCVTRDSETARVTTLERVQLWVNDMRTLRGLINTVWRRTPGDLAPKLSLGKSRPFQEGETPDTTDYHPFLGEVKDVHVWDLILSPCEIKRFIDYKEGCSDAFTPGNAVNWKALEFTQGTVSIKQA